LIYSASFDEPETFAELLGDVCFYSLYVLQDNACRASVDSLNNAYGCGPSLRSRGLLLQSVATAQSTMDYSTMAVDEGVVDSPVNLSVPKTLKSPSPMWPRTALQALSPKRQSSTPTKRALYNNVDEMPSPPPAKVGFHF
jgi:hypothetical protein